MRYAERRRQWPSSVKNMFRPPVVENNPQRPPEVVCVGSRMSKHENKGEDKRRREKEGDRDGVRNQIRRASPDLDLLPATSHLRPSTFSSLLDLVLKTPAAGSGPAARFPYSSRVQASVEVLELRLTQRLALLSWQDRTHLRLLRRRSSVEVDTSQAARSVFADMCIL